MKLIGEIAARLFLNGVKYQRVGGNDPVNPGGYYVMMGRKIGYVPDTADDETIRMTLEAAMKE